MSGRNLLSEVSLLKAITPSGIFATGDTMTVDVYKDGSSTPEALTTGTVSQISTLGIFYWPFSDLVTAPTALSQYTVHFKDATTKVYSKTFEFGGWAELLLSLPANLQDADMCRITTSLFRIDGSCSSEPGVVSRDNNGNTINLKLSYSDGSRYFELGSFKPSYDEASGGTYWLLPQAAIVDVDIQAYGISKKSALVPSVSTIDLKVWLDSL